MRYFLFASHGQLASGLKSSINLLAGEQEQITAIDAFGEDGEPDQKIANFFAKIKDDDEVYVLVDLSFGSVSQKIIPYLKDNIQMIAGMNLPLALQLILANETIDLPLIIEEAKASITDVKTVLKGIHLDDDDE